MTRGRLPGRWAVGWRWTVLLVLLLGVPSFAKTTLDIQPGYDGRFRAGRWSPIFVEVKSDQPRTAIIELHVPNASASAITIRQAIGVGTEKQKYVLYAPLAILYNPVRARLIDAESGKLLAEWPTEEDRNEDRGGEQVGFLVVSAGRSPVMQGFRRANSRGTTIVSHQRPILLPATPIGYDAADIVFLNDPEWARIAPEQQNALIAWVRAGGTLIVYPGADPVPADAPVAGLLPCEVGGSGVAALSEAQRKALGLGDRFASIAHRALTAHPGAKEVGLPSNIAKAVTAQAGLGSVIVLPVDCSTLQFNSGEQFQRFWEETLKTIFNDPATTPPEPSYYQESDILAAHAALDRIGNIPNTGSFGFGYIAVVVGGLMLVVGPIDWLILKKLGRQPWTWATTLGWIGVVTCCALYAGHVLRSGDLHFRTLRTIEQAAGRVVSMEDVALIYAPRSATYGVTSDVSEWWQPVPSGYRYASESLTTSLRSEQTYRGNTPDPMWIDIWNWRFLRGTRYVDQAPILDAQFKVTGVGLKGQITNRGGKKLRHLVIQHSSGWCSIPGEIEPGKTLEVQAKLTARQPTTQEMSVYSYSGVPISAPGNELQDLSHDQLETIFGLSPARETAVKRLENNGAIIVYANVDQPDTELAVTNPGAITEQTVLLRAVFNPNP